MNIIGGQRVRIKPLRRASQLTVLSMLIIIPYLTSNPFHWSPSRIALGQSPQPKIFQVSGDLWSLTLWSLKLSHPVAFIEETISAKKLYTPFLISALIPLVITITFGRVFCSWMCPVGFILELNQKVNKALRMKGLNRPIRMRDLRYTILVISLIFSFFFAFPLISIFDPPHYVRQGIDVYIHT
jgi:ferredoxin-type protein NapH